MTALQLIALWASNRAPSANDNPQILKEEWEQVGSIVVAKDSIEIGRSANQGLMQVHAVHVSRSEAGEEAMPVYANIPDDFVMGRDKVTPFFTVSRGKNTGTYIMNATVLKGGSMKDVVAGAEVRSKLRDAMLSGAGALGTT